MSLNRTWVKGLYALFFLLIIPFAYSLEECKDNTITENDIPCLIFLPVNNTECSTFDVSIFKDNISSYNTTLTEYTNFLCQFEFNKTAFGTYSFQYSNGDSGSIIVEEPVELYFFNLAVYVVMFAASIIFIMLAHNHGESDLTSIVLGTLGFTFAFITSAMIYSGFQVLRGITLFFDVNYYLGILSLIIGVYGLFCTINTFIEFKKESRTDEQRYYDGY